ncbi:hypothetical protein EJ357_38595 [Streptomyces cyaneochromogenes]|uniref:Uncharacterized protein n=1 Tax=Streptomyces cyaneochromogenes TaxID=2496836 RepID=A0A3Q9EYL3_9ACTN|nr:hypothetical protein EJ357_38595 [Streptomyces cyaneochromogenes]
MGYEAERPLGAEQDLVTGGSTLPEATTTELLRCGHRSGDGPCSATSEAPGLLIEMSDVSITLLGGLVGRPSCRT